MSKGPSKYDEALFSIIKDQRQGIEFIQRSLADMVDLQDAIMSQQERIIKVTGDLTVRVQNLEEKEQRRGKLRVIK